jgi:hypothetical protein
MNSKLLSNVTTLCSNRWMDNDSHGRPFLRPTEHGDHLSSGLNGALAAVGSGSLWTLLRQAPSHQMSLLMPAHPSPKRLAVLRSWIQACVTSVSRARSQETQTAGDAEAAETGEIAMQLAAIADAFSMYASMLERSRIASQPEPGLPPPPPRSLATIADDERLLLSCRAALRSSIQDLITALETGS